MMEEQKLGHVGDSLTLASFFFASGRLAAALWVS
jgi:hypothetical protein